MHESTIQQEDDSRMYALAALLEAAARHADPYRRDIAAYVLENLPQIKDVK